MLRVFLAILVVLSATVGMFVANVQAGGGSTHGVPRFDVFYVDWWSFPQPMWVGKTTYRDEERFFVVGEACPSSPQAAAELMGGNPDNWSDLGMKPWDGFRKWKFQSGTPVTLRYPGFGTYDHWRIGEGHKGDVPDTDVATFNCSRTGPS